MIKMFLISIMLCSFALLCSSLDPLTHEELRQIRDFTAKAHMKRQQFYPDQIMTPSTHYMGRRIPPNGEKQPSIFMQAPQNGGVPVPHKQIEPQPSGAVQNYLINYPITTNTITQGPPPPQQQQQLFFQQQQRPSQQQLQYIQQLQQNGNFPRPLHQNGPPPRGPPPPPPRRPSFFSFGGSGPESAQPTSLLEFFFPKRSSRRPPSYRPPLRFEHAQTSYNPTALLQQHHQSLHSVMAQQHALAVQQQQIQQQQQVQQQQQQVQQAIVQPSVSPIQSAQSSTVKNGAQINPTVVTPSVPSPAPVIPAAQLIHQNPQQFFAPRPPHPAFHPNQFHRELSYFGKPPHHGKPQPPQKFTQPPTAYVPQNRPGDADNYIQKFVSPQSDFSFLNLGPHVPPVIAGPTRFNDPVSFSHIEQMPFAMHQSPQLPMHMVVQSQEFPHYHFTTHFTASNPGGSSTESLIPSGPSPTSVSNTIITNHKQVSQNQKNQQQSQNNQHQSQSIQHQSQNNQYHSQKNQQQNTPITSNLDAHVASLESSTIRQTQRVKKIRHRPSTTQVPTEPTTTPSPSTTQSLGDIIFESAKETREFHDSAHLVAPTVSNADSSPLPQQKPRKNKSHKQSQHLTELHAGSLQKASVESSSVVLAPLVTYEQTNEPLTTTTTTTTTSSPRPITSTLVSVSTISAQPTPPPFKASKVVKARNPDYHTKSKNHNNHNNHHNHERRVTASGAGFGAITEPHHRQTTTSKPTSTSSYSSSSPRRQTQSPSSGRVVTTSVTSRVVSSGPHYHHPNPQNHPHPQPHHQNPQKRYRLRKVKVPNPEALKANNQKTSASSTTTTSFSSSSSTTNFPSSTTPSSSPRTPRSTSTATSTTSPSTPSASSSSSPSSSSTTISSTESSLTTTTV